MSATQDRLTAFQDEYVESRAWEGDKDPETCRENARKYATSLRGTADRLGWFEWLESERGKSATDATTKDVRGYLLFLKEEGLSGPTRTQARSAISLYYQLMEPDGENPVEGLDGSWRATTDKENATGELRSHPSRREIQALIENVPTPTLRSELIIKLLYQTGVRRMELATIQVERIDLDAQEIQVYADKTDEWRTVAFRESLRQPLRLWLNGKRQAEAGYYDGNPYLFPSPSTRGDNDHISGETIRQTVHQAAENAGIQGTYGEDVDGKNQHKITPHALRHAFAVHAAENGVPAPHLKEVLGHHSLDITQIYANIAGADAADMLKEKGPSLSGN